MNYNLTKLQREGLGWIVGQVRAGKLEEYFVIGWNGPKVFIADYEDADLPYKLLSSGIFDAWEKAQLVIIKPIKSTSLSPWSVLSHRCTLTQSAFDAVDANFTEPEIPPNSIRLQNFLASNAFFKFEDLRTLATIIGLDHEAISGSDKSTYARELVLTATRRGILWNLVRAAFTIE